MITGATGAGATLVEAAGINENLVNAAGDDTALPDTDSAVTVHGTGEFKKMAFTVNQTSNLVNQAISVSWTGGEPTDNVTGIANNYVEIMQCWGDPVTAADGSKGPPPENCEFGAQSLKYVSGTPGVRVASQVREYQDRDRGDATVDVPFHAVDGKSIPLMTDNSYNLTLPVRPWWLNPYFDYFSTNEIPYAPTYLDGRGSQLFTTDTGLEAPGLGCAQATQVQANLPPKIPKCWLVIVPRSNNSQEHGGQPPFDLDSGVQGAPFQPRVWAHRVAVPLEFKPLATPCLLGADERRIVGSELLAPAMSNWTPTLCASAHNSPFNYAPLSDNRARAQLTGASVGGAGMSVVSRPLDPKSIPAGATVSYAPLALTSMVVGFNIERALVDPASAPGGQVPAAEVQLAAKRLQHINLTPRLVAKLLTASYQQSFVAVPEGANYDWARKNPPNVAFDPEFVKHNPEFQLLTGGVGQGQSGLVVELSSSDATYGLWQWIKSDPEATAWLAGKPDPDGMKVNPFYSTSPKVNPSKQGIGLPMDNFPKNDPYSFKQADAPSSFPSLGMVDLLPYQNSFRAAALATRIADLGDRTVYSPENSGGPVGYTPNGPQIQGSRFVLSVTDAASAARYGLQTASLRNAAGKFVAPTTAAVEAGLRAMTPSAVPGVLLSNPETTSPDAYPLTNLVYAAAVPTQLDVRSRKDYASFLRFAAGSGQTPGVSFGRLLPGYEPLPIELRRQALAASAVIDAGGSVGPTSTKPPTTGPTSTPVSTPPTTRSSAAPAFPIPSQLPAPTNPATVSHSTSAADPPPADPPTTAQGDPPVVTRSAPGAGGPKTIKGPAKATSSSPSPKKASATVTAGNTSSSSGAPAPVALRTPRDPVTPPILPIVLGVGLLAAILAPFISRKRIRH